MAGRRSSEDDTLSPRAAAKQRAEFLASFSDPKVRQYEAIERSNDPTRHHSPEIESSHVVRAAERMKQVYAERGRKS